MNILQKYDLSTYVDDFCETGLGPWKRRFINLRIYNTFHLKNNEGSIGLNNYPKYQVPNLTPKRVVIPRPQPLLSLEPAAFNNIYNNSYYNSFSPQHFNQQLSQFGYSINHGNGQEYRQIASQATCSQPMIPSTISRVRIKNKLKRYNVIVAALLLLRKIDFKMNEVIDSSVAFAISNAELKRGGLDTKGNIYWLERP
ncbi:unnamed protein product [Mytilus coruscus]|uniref:Uncharacterized protein n=1 Tax=Mytilus coruscus TaxID=42192 RepID=A0A6J8CZ42_MYTCO|nr:unnamed protein product [Mytilus coruscus]